MFLLFGSKSKTSITKGGERLTRKCPRCGATGEFHEATTKTAVTAFVAVELFTDEAVVFVCAACHEAMPKDQTLPPVLSAAETARAQKLRDEQAAAAKKSAQLAAAARQEKVDTDLAALKKKMGLG